MTKHDPTKPGQTARPKHVRVKPATPAELERQSQVFAMHVDGHSTREIAKKLELDRDTVMLDIRREADRVADELRDRREQNRALAVSRYDRIAKTAIAIADERNEKNAGSALGAAVRAQERIDKVLGSEAPLKAEIGADPSMKALLDALAPKK